PASPIRLMPTATRTSPVSSVPAAYGSPSRQPLGPSLTRRMVLLFLRLIDIAAVGAAGCAIGEYDRGFRSRFIIADPTAIPACTLSCATSPACPAAYDGCGAR
ncbi:hypothetical protein Vretimale_9681, partial [Volvox reticuliferus]